MNHDSGCQHKGFVKWFLSWRGIVATILLAAFSYYLLTEHREHLALALPYLFLLACPLFHIFGHQHGKAAHDKPGNKK
ncbi:MAG: DUF2933 domain-containing protein [Micavibrio sp.]|nr:DUF2933 domain-containing protein [Micavibrio sp.]